MPLNGTALLLLYFPMDHLVRRLKHQLLLQAHYKLASRWKEWCLRGIQQKRPQWRNPWIKGSNRKNAYCVRILDDHHIESIRGGRP